MGSHTLFQQNRTILNFCNSCHRLHTYIRLTALCPGLPRWAGTRKVKPIWILLKQEIVSGGGISWAICKSAPRSRQITMPAPHHSVFTGRMPFLPPNQQRQSTEGKGYHRLHNGHKNHNSRSCGSSDGDVWSLVEWSWLPCLFSVKWCIIPVITVLIHVHIVACLLTCGLLLLWQQWLCCCCWMCRTGSRLSTEIKCSGVKWPVCWQRCFNRTLDVPWTKINSTTSLALPSVCCCCCCCF